MTRHIGFLLISSILLIICQDELVQGIPKTNENICSFGQECVQRHLCENKSNHNENAKLCGFMLSCCKSTDIISAPILPTIRTNQSFDDCGYRNSNARPSATNSESPWTVVILQDEDGELLNQFGGSIIAPTVVLTSAHKVKNLPAKTLLVRAGHLANAAESPREYQENRVGEIILHAQFHEGQLLNDIALLIVSAAFAWNAQVRPICLPPQDTNFDGGHCFATGWSRDEFDLVDASLSDQNQLNEIEVSVVSSFKCQASLRTTFLGGYFQLHSSFICAGGEEGRDTCKGDGGAPLVCPVAGQRNRFQLAGIVSWGIGCGQANVPGVYVNVASYRQWIEGKLSERSIGNQHYIAELK